MFSGLFLSGISSLRYSKLNRLVKQNSHKRSGIVKSSFESGGYSYIEVEAETGVLWLAAPVTTVKNGDTVTWKGASTMNNFYSKTLNRTFESILFVGRVAVNSPAG